MNFKSFFVDSDDLDFFKGFPLSFTDSMREGLIRGICARVIDGDTMVFYVELPFNNIDKVKIRLTHKIGEHFNAYETRGVYAHPKGHEAKEYVTKILLGKPVYIRSGKQSFNRWVGEVYFNHKGKKQNLALLLNSKGLANPEKYKKK